MVIVAMQRQALSWPRNNYHVDRVELACSAIPNDIKYATYELANALANDTDSITGTTGDTLYKSVKLGEMEVEYNTSSQATGTVNNNVFDVYPWLQSYLGAYCLGGSGSYQVRMVRVEMAGALDTLFKNVAKQVVADLGKSFDHTITYTRKASPTYNTSTGALTTTDTAYSFDVPVEFVRAQEEEGREERQAKLFITPDLLETTNRLLRTQSRLSTQGLTALLK